MGIPKVTVKVKREGPTYDEINAVMVDKVVYAVLHDQESTPDQFAGFGRRGATPFKRTGELIAGLFFKRANPRARKVGLIGTIRAPASRFANSVVRDKFLGYVHDLAARVGVGWSVTSAVAQAALKKLEGMTQAQRDAFLGRGGR